MRFIALALIIAASAAAAPADSSAYAPLWLYQGHWRVTRNPSQTGKPEDLVNQCALVGKYFACQQTINAQTGNLAVFIAAPQPGHFYTQNITPEGRATGRADLQINGDLWTFTNTWDAGGHTVYYRTTNQFTGKNKIHFEQAESSDGKDYKVTASGDEVKSAASAR